MIDSVTAEDFDRMMEAALAVLPPEIREKMDNVQITIEDETEPPHLFGLYQGVPQNKRGIYYSMVLPDKITIFKKTLERYAQDKAQLTAMVRDVVIHEIAHHFGFTDADLKKSKQSAVSNDSEK